MSKFTAFLLFLFVVAAGYLAIYNREVVDVYLSENTFYQVSKILLMLISFGLGAVFVFAIYAVRDTKRFFNSLQTKRRQKKHRKLQRLFSEASSALNAGKTEQAISLLKEITAEDENNREALIRLGELYLERGELPKAENYFRKALGMEGETAYLLFQLAEIKTRQGNTEEALNLINDVLKEDPDNLRALYKKCEILDSLNRWEELVELHRALLKKVNDEGQKRAIEERLRGYSFELYREIADKAQFDRASKGLRSLLKQDDSFVPAHLAIAKIMLRENRQDEAINYLEDVFKRQGSLVLAARLEELLLKRGDPSRIINIYQDAIASGADSTMKFLLAKLYYRLEMLDDALETLESIDDPNLSSEISMMKGMIFHKRGQYDRASQEFIDTLNIGSILKIPYCCNSCGYIGDKYSARCPSCKEWNTFTFNLYGTCKVDKKE